MSYNLRHGRYELAPKEDGKSRQLAYEALVDMIAAASDAGLVSEPLIPSSAVAKHKSKATQYLQALEAQRRDALIRMVG